jgi:hypothetical protein
MNRLVPISAAVAAVMLPAGSALAQTAAASPAPTQAAAGPAVGATVYDGQGAEVGKIESVANGSAVVFTGSNRATIPLTSFGTSPKGPTLGMTKVELDAAAAKAAGAAVEQLRSQLTPGTPVRGTAGAVVATVKALDGDNVILSAGKSEVRVPIAGVGVNAQGIFIGMTQAEFDAAVAASAPTGG